MKTSFLDFCSAISNNIYSRYGLANGGIMKKVFFVPVVLAVLFFGCASTPTETKPEESPAVTETAPETASPPAVQEKPAPPPEISAATYYSQGNDFYNRNNFDEAINSYTGALKKDPGMADAYIARGNAYSGKLDSANAQNDYAAAANINGDYDHFARGYSLLAAKDYQSAVSEFTQAMAKKTNLFAAYNDRGVAYTNMGNQDLAIADFTEAITLNANSAFPYNNRGNSWLMKTSYDKAIEDYSKAMELYPALVFAYSGRGLANYRMKTYEKAIADYTKAIVITPKDPMLYSLRGDAYSARGDKALADADYAIARELGNP